MASVKLTKQIMSIIDPEYSTLPEGEVDALREDATEIIEAVEEHIATSKRLFIVGQIQYDGSEEVYTVALGPYGARGVLSDQEKFDKAAEASTAAHDAGGKLAWDTRTGKGRGRYMVVPVFRTARDAWDFYRASDDSDPDELVENVVQAIETAPYEIVPACICGHRSKAKCYRHVEK